MSLAWRMPGRLSRPLGVLYSHFHLSFSTCRMVMRLKKMHPTKMHSDCENRSVVCCFSQTSFTAGVLCFFSLPFKARKRLARWCSLGFSVGSPAAHPKLPHSLLPLQVQSTGDTVMTHSFLFSSPVCPLNSSLIHLTAYLWGDIPQQLKLNKYIRQLRPFLQNRSSSFTLSSGEWYLTSNSSLRTETWTPPFNPFITSHSALLILSSRILWRSTSSLLPLVRACFGPAPALIRALQEPSTHLPASPSQHDLQRGLSAVSESVSQLNKNHSIALKQEAQSPQSSFPPANKPSDFLLVLTLVSLLSRASLVAQTIKNPPASGDLGSFPGLGRSPGGGHGNPLQYSCLENPHGQRSLLGNSPKGRKESDTTEAT